MAKCSNCGAKIDRLSFYVTRSYVAEVELVDGKLVHSNEVESEDRGYDCPECGRQVCEDDSRAIEFLKGS